MTEEVTPATDRRSGGRLATVFEPGGDRSLLVDAALGAVVTVLLSFVPLAPVLGGAVSAYLNRDREVLVGALSGLVAAIPSFLVVAAFLLVVPLGLGIAGADIAGGIFIMGLFVLLGLFAVTVWNLLLGALGGVAGAAIADRYPEPPW